MKYKEWSIQYVTNDGQEKFSRPKVVSMSIKDAIEKVCQREGIDANQIIYANGEEIELV